MTEFEGAYSVHTDHADLLNFGIKCIHTECESNKIYLDKNLLKENKPQKLNIYFSGENNSVTLIGNNLPQGSISFIGNNSNVVINRENDVNLRVFLYENSNLHIEKCFSIFGLFASIYAGTTLRIRENCLIADNVKIWTFDHHAVIDLKTMKQRNFPQDVDIGPHVWIGESVQILKGTRIKAGSIISAGAVVRGLIPSRELWGGNPARRIRREMSWTPSHPANSHDLDVMLSSISTHKTRWFLLKKQIRKHMNKILKLRSK
ncbi:acyltransferase [Gluconacetobacter sp. Hr-1-5]|uniref:acyltransferase n=1 Tax=Gluconacetobacter sp. Hr-1-5 TaxID=3395370 RepID=UPI003B516407